MTKYKRILIKISGEALCGKGGQGIAQTETEKIACQIAKLHSEGFEIALVIGGGNFWRARQNPGIERITSDQIGMLATVMNSLAMQNALQSMDVPVVTMSAVPIEGIAGAVYPQDAELCLTHGNVVIFAGGTGSPFFTTDTAGALRAAEISADIYLCAKSVDGVYDSDPEKNPGAKRFDKLTFSEVIERQLKAMDLTAMPMCMENNIPALIFDCGAENAVYDAAHGKKIGTIIENT